MAINVKLTEQYVDPDYFDQYVAGQNYAFVYTNNSTQNAGYSTLESDYRYVKKSGDTMTGTLNFSGLTYDGTTNDHIIASGYGIEGTYGGSAWGFYSGGTTLTSQIRQGYTPWPTGERFISLDIFDAGSGGSNSLSVNNTEAYTSHYFMAEYFKDLNGHFVTDTSGNITTDGYLKGDELVSNDISYTQGFTGDGYKLYKETNNEYTLELDNLMVRNRMTVYELLIKKIRATNGSLWVSSAMKSLSGLTWDSAEHTYYFDFEIDKNYFSEDDIIKSQAFNGHNVHSETVVVYKIDDTNSRVYVKKYPEKIVNDDYMQWLGVSGATASEPSANAGYSFHIDSPGQYISNGVQLSLKKGLYYVDVIYGTLVDGDADISIYDNDTNTTKSNIMQLSDGYLHIDSDLTNAEFHITLAQGETVYNASGMKIMIYDTTFDSTFDCTDWDWVRIGNITDEDRQGALYLSADEETSPYMDVYDGVTGTTINWDNTKVRLGRLDGVKFRGEYLSGYGLYGDNVYLKGEIVADKGEIGGWYINDNGLSKTGTTGGIIMNSDDTTFEVVNPSGVTSVRLFNGPQTDLNSLIDGTSLAWQYPTTSSGYTSTFTTETYNTVPGHTVYIQQKTAGSNTVIQQSTSRSSSNYITINANKVYTSNAEILINTGGFTTDSGYHLSGNYDVKLQLAAHDASTNILYLKYLEIENQYCLTPLYIKPFVNALIGNISSSSMYFRLTVVIYSKVTQTNDHDSSDVKTISGQFHIFVNSLDLNGAAGLTELSTQGLLSVWDSDEYLQIDGNAANSESDPFIKSDGYWVHNGREYFKDYTYVDSTLTVNSGGRLTTDFGSSFDMYGKMFGKSYTYTDSSTFTISGSYMFNIYNGSTSGVQMNLPSSPGDGQILVTINNASVDINLNGNGNTLRHNGTDYTGNMTFYNKRQYMWVYFSATGIWYNIGYM